MKVATFIEALINAGQVKQIVQSGEVQFSSWYTFSYCPLHAYDASEVEEVTAPQDRVDQKKNKEAGKTVDSSKTENSVKTKHNAVKPASVKSIPLI